LKSRLPITEALRLLALTSTNQNGNYIFAAGNLNSPTFEFKEGTFGTIGKVPVPTKDTPIPLSTGIGGSQLFQIAQPITQLYKINLGIHEQQLAFDYTNQEYRAKRQSLVSDVKQAYYGVLQSESALEVAKASVTQYEETDRVALQYVAQEAILKSDSLDVKAKLAQAKYQVIHLNNDLQTRKEHLNDLLARDLITDFHTQAVPPQSFEEIDLKAAQQTALAQRPEVAEANINVKKATYDRKLAHAQYIPDVSASFHYLSLFTAQILPPNIVSAGVEINWEPFDWGRRHDVVKQKEISLTQSQVQLEQVRSQILQDVNNRFRSLQESRAAIEVAQAARDASTEKLREVNDKFSREAVLLRDVLQQHATVANANYDYEQALLWAKTDLMKIPKAAREISTLLTAAGIAFGMSGCQEAGSEPKPATPVRVAEVTSIRAGNAVRYSANIVPYAQVDLAFKSGGYVTSIRHVKSNDGGIRNVDAGDWVQKDTVLAVVDQQDYLNKLEQAKAQLERAQAEYDKAKLSFDRIDALYASKSATKPDHDSARAQLDSAAATVTSAKAQISDAQIALGYCSLRAPFDSWIVDRSVDVGALVGPATKGFSVADTRSVKAVFGLPDISIRQVKLGQTMTITSDAVAGEFRGRVTSISPAADPKSRVYSVEVTIQNPNNALMSGMIASLGVGGGELAKPVLAVPLSSVIRNSSGTGFAVMLATGAGDRISARLRPVELGDAYGNFVGITNGLTPGDKVITTGVTLVKDGDMVRVIP
jgi:outer membrane protein